MTLERTAAPERAAVRLDRRLTAWVDARWTVAVAAALAFAFRLPGLTRPVRADEAGFVLVARQWAPTADSLYGPYFVDRPPLLIAVFKVSDAVGGPLTIRVLGALACAASVLVAAWLARLVADERAARWTAVATAALSTSALIDVVAVKGELLAVPLVTASLGLSVLAVRDRAAAPAAAAGALATLAVGLKQNLVGALAFAAVLYAGAWLAGRLVRTEAVKVALAFAAGAAVPVLATVGWALVAGIRLHTLWYTVYGFRFDASRVLSEASDSAPTVRLGVLVLAALGAGLLPLLAWFVRHARGAWAEDAPLTAALLAMLAVDLLGLALGGSFWRDYLFPLLPSAVLAVALTARHRGTRLLVGATAASCVVSLVGWAALNAVGGQEYDEHDTGAAVGAVAEPGDTLVVYGGRADVQLAAGLPSPYAYLWSLPMRTLDPRLEEIEALVTGPEPPTWVVEWVAFENWEPAEGARLAALVAERYDRVGTGCGDRPVWLLRGQDRAEPRPDCRGPGFWFSSGP